MRTLFLLFMFSTAFLHAKSAVRNQIGFTITNTVSIKNNDAPTTSLKLLAKMSFKQIESYLGRKLKFKEKLALTLLKYKVKHGLKTNDEPTSKKGRTSLTLGILALVTLFLFPLATIPLGILAITNGNEAKKINPNDSNAKTGVILGIISLSLIVLAIIAILAVLYSLGLRF